MVKTSKGVDLGMDCRDTSLPILWEYLGRLGVGGCGVDLVHTNAETKLMPLEIDIPHQHFVSLSMFCLKLCYDWV